jgi:arylsulfatase
LKDNILQYVHNYAARDYFHFQANQPTPTGRHQLRYEFEVTGPPDIAAGKGTPGRGQLYIDNQLVGQLDLPVTTPISVGLTSGIRAGSAPGAPIGDYYEPPFEFTGTLYSVTVDVSGELIRDTEAELRAVMARQ